jgi:zinc/manganese transport system ATP-binding protein
MEKNGYTVDLRNISTIYEGEHLPVIKNINMNISPGEFVSIIGPNGAGKTTILETINGLLPYTGGRGFVFGKEINKNKSLIRSETGYVIQNYEIDPLAPFLCKDVVMSGRSGKIGLLRFIQKKDWDKVWYSMGLVGMIDFASRPVGKLSGGEFQKIIIARALAQQPQLLLLDEPFSNLDHASCLQIQTLLNRLHERHKITIILVLHNLKMIPENCNRIIVLDKGKIVLDGQKNSVLESSVVDNLFHNGGK